MTPFIKKKEIKNDWYIVDAENLVVGRLASYISKMLRGKNKAKFNPNIGVLKAPPALEPSLNPPNQKGRITFPKLV